ncbi:hypothetical protein EYF80_015120 [Liparis tanakae]|uniref:Uncharacterized protein n=1 Tax=Liparis tanakae TaxID=230148 RepID=A0A4Z2IBU8_9TELE|nr:hypothetical protein EYF80_015120 [Liparis tanakae]
MLEGWRLNGGEMGRGGVGGKPSGSEAEHRGIACLGLNRDKASVVVGEGGVKKAPDPPLGSQALAAGFGLQQSLTLKPSMCDCSCSRASSFSICLLVSLMLEQTAFMACRASSTAG